MKLSAISLLNICVFSTLSLAAVDPVAEDLAVNWKATALRAQASEKAGDFSAAAITGKQALLLAKNFGESDQRLATTYHLLGIIYRDWGHCAEARSSYLHAIAIWRRVPNPNPHYTFNSIVSLVSLLCECDDFRSAEKAFRAYQPELQRYRSGEVGEAKMISLEGAIARGKKDYLRAEAFYRQAITLLEKAPDANPSDIAIEHSSLGVILDKQGRYAESLAESNTAIAFMEKHSTTHSNFVAALNNAACTLASLGRRDESERMFQRAIEASLAIYGEDNHVTAKIMLSYAQVLREAKQSPAADVWRKKGAEAFRRALARDNGVVDVEELRANRK